MTVIEFIEKHFKDVSDGKYHDWRVFGLQALDDSCTIVSFYDSYGHKVREFEIGIDGIITDITDVRIGTNSGRGKKSKG